MSEKDMNIVCDRCKKEMRGEFNLDEPFKLWFSDREFSIMKEKLDKEISRLKAENEKAKDVINKKIYPYFVCGDCRNMITKETHYCEKCYYRAIDELKRVYSSSGVKEVRKQERRAMIEKIDKVFDMIEEYYDESKPLDKLDLGIIKGARIRLKKELKKGGEQHE